jgi:hypothetical protein
MFQVTAAAAANWLCGVLNELNARFNCAVALVLLAQRLHSISSTIWTRGAIPRASATRSPYLFARLFQISFKGTTEFVISVSGDRKNR